MNSHGDDTTAPSRRDEMTRARRSRRPSRLDAQSGATGTPDRVLNPSAGFPSLLAQVHARAQEAPDTETALETLLTLDGHVPADIQLRGLRLADMSAVSVLRAGHPHGDDEPTDDQPVSYSELGLTTTGRLVVGVPGSTGLAERHDLVGDALRLRWSSSQLAAYRDHLSRSLADYTESAAQCRAWLDALGPDRRREVLDELIDAARRTAPFVLHQEDQLYTNFRERNNLAGKTLYAGHPDCVLSSLASTPLPQWSSNHTVLVTCLALLVRSGNYARIEEANGTQLTLSHVAELFDRTRLNYNSASDAPAIAAVTEPRLDRLQDLADRLRTRRAELTGEVQLYREIYGPLMHKIERVAGPIKPTAHRVEAAICERLRTTLPLSGMSLAEMSADVATDPSWLVHPHGEFATGLESLIYQTVLAARDCFDVDFAMSRGLRGLSRLSQMLRTENWAEIVGWELPEFFCCVVPAPHAQRFFGDSPAQLADISWSMSARMQYNSWHFLAANLPTVPVVVDRDYFVAPTIPDIAYYSDQHHHGHVAAKVRFSIRSPQPVLVGGRCFNGFIDLRLLRCESAPFTEQDLLAAHRTSAFIAQATGHAATLSAQHEVRISAFDPSWHWTTVTTAATPTATGASQRR